MPRTKRPTWRLTAPTLLTPGWSVTGPSCRFGPWADYPDQGEAKAREMYRTLTGTEAP